MRLGGSIGFMSKKILLVEDDRFIMRAYSDGLERAGYEVLTAMNGQEVLGVAKAEVPDLILLDLIMPGLNGFEVLEELKADEQLSDTKIVIVSNLGQDSDVKKAKDLGAVDYLVKSDTSMGEVVDKAKELLGE